MNILITGSNGFIARNISKKINKKHNVIQTNRKTLNVLDTKAVTSFLANNKVDVIIHTAVSGGRRTKSVEISVLIDNLTMFRNFLMNRDKFNALIHFGSGAEFDRRTDISVVKEGTDANPVDYYGLSKKIINSEIKNTNNFFNLRVFGCFGIDEKEDRFIRSAITNVKNGQKIKIHQNRQMDFISIDDLCLVVNYYIENYRKKTLPKDINLCYNGKMSLLDISNKINTLLEKPTKNVLIEKEGKDIDYSGDGTLLEQLNLKLNGFDKSLTKIIKGV